MQNEHLDDHAHQAHGMKKMSINHRSKSHDKNHTDHEAAMTNPEIAKVMEADMRWRFWVAFVFSVPVFFYSPVGESLLGTLPAPIPVSWLLFILTTPIVFWAGSIFITGTYHALRKRKLNMSVLIATGVLAAYGFSVFLTLTVGGETFFEAAALLVTFVLFGHWMEMKSRRGTSESIRALFDLVPPKVLVMRDGKQQEILTAEIMIGDLIVIRPGDKIPVDGSVVSGETTIDESLVTGESLPVVKTIGTNVIGGSINQSGTINFLAEHIGSDTVLARIISLVETAQNSKAPGQLIADKAAAYLVVLAIAAGLITFFSWILFGDVSLVTALTFAVSAIVIACPDALGLATPTAVAVGTGIGAKHNILIKDAATLELTSKIQVIAIDKTGTLTEGKPQVTEVVTVHGFSQDEVLGLQAAVETGSNHPVGVAIVHYVQTKNILLPKKIEKFEALKGLGVSAIVNGKTILVGTERLMKDRRINLDPIMDAMNRMIDRGESVSILSIDEKVAAIIGVADVVRASAKHTIEKFAAIGIEVVMITGDHEGVAKVVAGELGIKRYFARILPEEKASYIKKLQDEGKFVAMVGDGINDAPALAQADIGIAIGAGTDVAIETANIVLMKSDPADILKAIMLSKATVRKMKQNLFWAAIYNVLAIPIAAGVFYPAFGWILRPEISALLMSASSIIVATNAVMLKRVESRLVSI